MNTLEEQLNLASPVGNRHKARAALWGAIAVALALAFVAVLRTRPDMLVVAWLCGINAVFAAYLAISNGQDATSESIGTARGVAANPQGMPDAVVNGDPEANRAMRELDAEIAACVKRGRVVYRRLPEKSNAECDVEIAELVKAFGSSDLPIIILPASSKP